MIKTLAICIFFVATTAARATSIIFPTYSTPILADDTLIVTSPDSKRLLSVSKTGEQKWQRQLSGRGSVFKHRSGKILLIVGSSVSVVSPDNGELTPLFDISPPVMNLRYQEAGDLFYGQTMAAGVPTLAVYDGATHASLLNEKCGESVTYADDEIIVLAKGERKQEKLGKRSRSQDD